MKTTFKICRLIKSSKLFWFSLKSTANLGKQDTEKKENCQSDKLRSP